MIQMNSYLKLAPYIWILEDKSIGDDLPPWVWERNDFNV